MPETRSTGELWTSRLMNADWRRRAWRNIASRSRHQFLGLPADDHEAVDFHGGLLYNQMYAAEQNIFALLRPDRMQVRLVPNRPDLAAQASNAQAVLNWLLREGDLTEVAAEVVQHARIDGIGIAKVEWGGIFTPRVDDDGESAIAIPDLKASGNGTGRRNRSVLEALQKAFPDDRVGRNIAQYYSIDGYDFLKDEVSPVLRNATWAGHRVWMTRGQAEDLQQSGYFERTDIVYDTSALPSSVERWHDALTMPGAGSPAGRSLMTPGQGRLRLAGDPDVNRREELIEVWEIHDRVEREVLFVVPGTKRVLRRHPMEIEAEGLPYVDLRFGSVPWEYWPVPDNYHYIQAQETLDSVMSSIADHAARFGKAAIMVNKSLPEDTKRAIAQSTGGSLIEVDDPRMIQPLNFGPLPPQLTEMVPLLTQLITQIAGITQPATGIASSGRTTATEIQAIGQQFSSRMRRMQLDLQRFLTRCTQRTLQLAQQFFTEEDAVPLLGVDAIAWGQQHTGPISSDDIKGDFQFELLVGAGAEQHDLLEKKQALDLYNMFAQNPIVSPAALAETVLRKFGENPDFLLQQQRQAPPLAPPGLEGQGQPQSPDFANRAQNPSAAAELTDLIR